MEKNKAGRGGVEEEVVMFNRGLRKTSLRKCQSSKDPNEVQSQHAGVRGVRNPERACLGCSRMVRCPERLVGKREEWGRWSQSRKGWPDYGGHWEGSELYFE